MSRKSRRAHLKHSDIRDPWLLREFGGMPYWGVIASGVVLAGVGGIAAWQAVAGS